MANLLIVEKDQRLARFITKEFRRHFSNIQVSSSLHDSLHLVLSQIPDIVLCDIDGEKEALALCAHIRNRKINVPILIMSSTELVPTIEDTFALQWSDYIAKPFHPDELRLRLENLLYLSRMFKHRSTPEVHSIDESLSVDFKRSLLIVDGREKHIPKTLKHLLELFLQHPNEILSHSFLQEKIWGDYLSTDQKREIRSHTKRLRALLGEKHGKRVCNVKSQGYIFTV